MKLATLIIISSAVLALQSDENSDHIPKLAKKDAAPAGGFRFPTEDEDNPYSENYRFKPDNDQGSGNNKPQQNVPLKDRKDNNGNSCHNYRGKQVKDVPEECMKTVFCRNGNIANQMGCGLVGFTFDNWTKQKLIDDFVTNDCVSTFICKEEDFYDA